MTRYAAVFAVLFLTACLDYSTGPTAADATPDGGTSVEVNQTVTIYPPPEPTPTPPASDDDALCPQARAVEVSGFGGPAPSTLAVGQVQRLDATPLDAQGQPRSAQCDELNGIFWSVAGGCALNDPTSFTPSLTAQAVGTCVVTASVEDVSDSLSFTVQ